MNKNLKKTLLIALAGAFVLTGAAAYNMPGHSAAAPYQMKQSDERTPGQMNKMFNAADYAQALADDFGVDKTAVEKALEAGWRPNDLQRAAFIAYASDKSLDDVLNAKTTTNNWRDVSDSCGVTPEKHHDAMRQLHCSSISAATGIAADTLNALANEGYHTRDITMAAVLANKSGKDINDVISQKTVTNRWSDIAESLGVSRDDIFDLMRQCGPHSMDGRHGFGPRDGMRGQMMNDDDFDNVSRHGGWHHRGGNRGDGYGDGYGGGYGRHC